MEIKVIQNELSKIDCDVIVAGLFEQQQELSGPAAELDNALGGIISQYVIEKDKFEAKFGQTYILQTYGKIAASKVLLVGLGKQEEVDIAKLRELGAKIAKKCDTALKAKIVCLTPYGKGLEGISLYDAVKTVVHGALIGAYKFDRYLAEKTPSIEVFEIVENNNPQEAENGAKAGQITGEAVNIARDLINEPASVVTPEYLAETALQIEGLETKVMDEDEVGEMGMDAFLAVSYGSAEEPKFIHMKYTPDGTPSKKIAIIGKGLTFDSGGLDLKPPKSMRNMKTDMSGAAAVIGIMSKIRELKPNVEVHALIAATENMPGCAAYKPGDIIRALNGKTIEVDNTDAEGRLTLADAIAYAAKLDVNEIIDIATLTGACIVALGEEAAGIMGNNQELIDNLIKAGEKGAERFWQLPLYPEHATAIKSPVADIKNTGSTTGGGAMTAAAFLKEFTDNKNWAHIDIAGPAYLEKEMRGTPKGASGFTVASLIEYLMAQ